MPRTYDGLTFVRIHPDATAARDLGGGVYASRPLSTWLENAIRSNTLYCGKPGSQVTWSPICDQASSREDGDATRPYASLGPSTILCVPWIVQPGLARVSLTALARCGTEDGSPTPLSSWLVLDRQLTALGAVGRGAQISLITGADYQQRDLSVELLNPAPASQVTDLRWMIASGREGAGAETPGDATLKSLNRLDAGSGSSTFYEDDLGDAHPNAVSLDLRATRDNDSGAWFDHLTAHSYYEPGLFGGQRASVRPVSPGPTQPPGRLGTAALSYLQVKAAEIRDEYDASLLVRPASAYRARVPVDARDEYQHLLALRAMHTRARCLWVGPQGEIPNPEVASTSWPAGYHRRFPQLQQDGGSSTARLFWIGFKPQTTDPKLRLILNVIPHARTLGVACEDLAGLAELSPTCEWSVKVEVYQYRDGETTTYGVGDAVASAQPLIHWPTDGGGAWTHLLQERLKVLHTLAGEYSYKEGQLFDEDLELIQRLEVEVPITFDPAGAQPWPLVALVSLSRDNATLVRPPAGEDTYWDPTVFDDLVVTCVGASLWELPQAQDYPIPPLGDWTHPGKIRAVEWGQVTRAADTHWRRLGGKTHLLCPAGRGSEPTRFSTTVVAPSWATVSSSGGPGVEQVSGGLRLSRPGNAAGDSVHFRLRGFLARVRVRVYLEGADGLVSDYIQIENTSTTPAWVEETYFFDLPDDHLASDPGQPLRFFRAWVQIQSTSAGEGVVYQLELQEDDKLPDSQLPKGA